MMPQDPTPRALILAMSKALEAAGVPDPVTDAAALLAHVTGRHALTLRLDTDTRISSDVLAAYTTLCERRKHREPLQWILGSQSFLGHDFEVGPHVLIPRPETELLAEAVIDRLKSPASPAVLDLCCGSGCIAVSVALARPDARVTASDLSPDALTAARRNAERLGAVVSFLQSDLLDNVDAGPFDVIVSNPPYIPSTDCDTLQEEVRREPRMALDGGPDGLAFYRRIAETAPPHLKPGGRLLLETGHDQHEAVAALLAGRGFREIRAIRDYAGIQRITEAVC